jgi:hypothetical protein
LADVIDISLTRHLTTTVDKLLEERGLEFFLKRSGALPFSIDARRIHLAVELAARKAGRKPAEAARKAAYEKVRKRLIKQVAAALVQVGL